MRDLYTSKQLEQIPNTTKREGNAETDLVDVYQCMQAIKVFDLQSARELVYTEFLEQLHG